MLKCIKIIFILFLKIIFEINASKRFKTQKKLTRKLTRVSKLARSIGIYKGWQY
jgi:hypothetical protein